MSDAKIDIKVGEISFHGEGSQEWLEKQLDKIINKSEALLEISHVNPPLKDQTDSSIKSNSENLAQFIKNNNVTRTIDIFLAAAIWVTSKGQDKLTPKDVTAALRTANQKKLSNASVFLKQNIQKGFCEMDGKSFFVTEQGKAQYS